MVSTDFASAAQAAERAQLIADLKAARAELVARGWCRGVLVDDGRVCAMGAVGAATVEGFMDLPFESQQEAALNDERPSRCWTALETRVLDTYGGVMLFNDKADTLQDVLDLFDKTLADLGGLA